MTGRRNCRQTCASLTPLREPRINITTTNNDVEGPGGRSNGTLARHSLVFFFLLAFVFTWGYFWLVLAPLKLPRAAYVLGGFGPAAAAFIMLGLTSGTRGVVALLRSIVHWRVGFQWYLLLLVGLPVLNVLVPVYGVSVDKALALRGDPQLRIAFDQPHQHIHAHINESTCQNILARLPRRNTPTLPLAPET